MTERAQRTYFIALFQSCVIIDVGVDRSVDRSAVHLSSLSHFMQAKVNYSPYLPILNAINHLV